MGAVLATLGAIASSIASVIVNAGLAAGLFTAVVSPEFAFGAYYAVSTGTATIFQVATGGFILETLGLTTAGYWTGVAIGGAALGIGLGVGLSPKTGSIGSGGVAYIAPTFRSISKNQACSFKEILYGGNGNCELFSANKQSLWVENRKKGSTTLQSSGKNSGSEVMERELQSGQSGPTETNKVVKQTKRLR